MNYKYRKILLEQANQSAGQFTDQKLRLAYLGTGNDPLKGCFTQYPKPQPYKYPKYTDGTHPEGTDVLYRIDTEKNLRYVFGDGTWETRTPDGKLVGTPKKWYCEKLVNRQDAIFNPTIQEFVDAIKKEMGAKLYGEATEAELQNYQIYDITNLIKDQGFLNKFGSTYADRIVFIKNNITPGNVYVYVPKTTGRGLSTQVKTGQELIDDLMTKNWSKNAPTDGSSFIKIDLSNKESIKAAQDKKYSTGAFMFPELTGVYPIQNLDQFGSVRDYTLYKSIGNYDSAQATKDKTELNSLAEKVGTTLSTKKGLFKPDEFKVACIALYRKYVTSANSVKMGDSEKEKLFAYLQQCENRVGKSIRQTNQKLAAEVERLGYTKSKDPRTPIGWIGYQVGGMMNEEKMVRSLVSKALNEIKLNKKKTLISESGNIKNRMSIVVENINIRTKLGKDIFCEHLIHEIIRINQMGKKYEVLKENMIWDAVKGFFSGNVVDSIFEYFKEYGAGWLLTQIGIREGHWLYDPLKVAFGNLPLGEIPKLFECKYLTHFLSETFLETLLKKFSDKVVKVDNPISNVTRNVIMKMFNDSKMGEVVESALGEYVCPLVGEMKNKFGNITDKLKTQEPSKSSSLPNSSSSTEKTS
jgi:hypothetical protein